MKYKDFPKHDLRRCFSVLLTIEQLGEKATAHYASLALECTRAEVLRAIDLAREQLRMRFEKIGSSYRIDDWGVVNRNAVMADLRASPARETEDSMLGALIDAIRAERSPSSHGEADLFRFAAQLLKTRYPMHAKTLDSAARSYFDKTRVKPRSFPQMVSDGLVTDVARFRHAIENRLEHVCANA
ncbi:hypothetical protein [Pseudoduganella violaceinigra]|uniref:hypothetical protein n=1 Tax=Pseudoduganella violaceinigra TaxID=246602 RepID=UPI000483A1EA|nr:hypothetical protein [Pseudoduganella violaceinigra]